jgi:hypothetical protein
MRPVVSGHDNEHDHDADQLTIDEVDQVRHKLTTDLSSGTLDDRESIAPVSSKSASSNLVMSAPTIVSGRKDLGRAR